MTILNETDGRINQNELNRYLLKLDGGRAVDDRAINLRFDIMLGHSSGLRNRFYLVNYGKGCDEIRKLQLDVIFNLQYGYISRDSLQDNLDGQIAGMYGSGVLIELRNSESPMASARIKAVA